MPLNGKQQTEALSWLDERNPVDCFCLLLALRLSDGEAPATVMGCDHRCKVTGQNGGTRDQAAIDDLARRLKSSPS